MSGICGILHLDGRRVDPAQLQSLTGFLAFRGPDAQATWSEGPIGLGHALLRTVDDAGNDRQPATLDGTTWISADARIDDQAGLRARMAATGQAVPARASDAELILHAYRTWGDDCLQHLIGDFCFALWDGRRRRLLCARDHFGIKPFFHARVGDTLVFGNTLDGLRQHPGVSSRLDDLAIADFLLFEGIQDPTATSFADIRRLPPGHSLQATAEVVEVRPYWTLPRDIVIRERPRGEYLEQFRHLLEQAVSDRLRTTNVGLEMSGGIDSAAMAATAHALLGRSGKGFELHAHTIVYDRLIPDRERHFSTLLARHLGIPHLVFAADGYGLFERQEEALATMPEPVNTPNAALYLDVQRTLPTAQRVILTGWDGDALLNDTPKPYFRQLARQRRYPALLAATAGYALWQGRWGPLAEPFRLRRKNPERPAPPGFPEWLNADLVSRFGLRRRFDAFHGPRQGEQGLRPNAIRALSQVIESSAFFDGYDAGCHRQAREYRHPLMDLRLVEFCLSLPPYPWCIRKHLLREALRGTVPEEVRRRPKTPLAGHPHLKLLAEQNELPFKGVLAGKTVSRYIDEAQLPPNCGQADPMSAWNALRAHSLAFWLQHPRVDINRSQ